MERYSMNPRTSWDKTFGQAKGSERFGGKITWTIALPRLALEAANPHTFVLHSRQTREDPLELDIRGDGYVKSWKAPFDPFPGISPLATCKLFKRAVRTNKTWPSYQTDTSC